MKKSETLEKNIVEDFRQKYAEEDNLSEFRKLYSTNMTEIPNMNIGTTWDKLNKKTRLSLANSPIYKNKISIVYKLLRQQQGNLLDIGFGSGFIERKLSKTNLKLFGIDIAQESVSNINKSIKGVFKIGTVLNIPFKPNFFNNILLLDVLEHVSVKNTFQALREVNRVLKKGGRLIVSVPLNEGLKNLISSRHNVNMHVREYTQEILKTEVSFFNFVVVKEYLLYAFNKFYFFKNILTRTILKKYRMPNLYILVLKKK